MIEEQKVDGDGFPANHLLSSTGAQVKHNYFAVF